MAADNAWLNSSPAERDPFARRSEHLEPDVGAVLLFQGMPDGIKDAEGQRYSLREKYPGPGGLWYYLRRVDDDRYACTVNQEIMDRCGRLLVGREEQAG